jgi:hypothetical protein
MEVSNELFMELLTGFKHKKNLPDLTAIPKNSLTKDKVFVIHPHVSQKNDAKKKKSRKGGKDDEKGY